MVRASLTKMASPGTTRLGLWLLRHRIRREFSVAEHRRRRMAARAMPRPSALPIARRDAGSVWGITLVKDEVDIIEITLRHQLNQGLDGIIVADNCSTDGTAELLQELASTLPVFVTNDGWSAHYQGVKMSLLAAMARRAGARWIVPFDADELWFAREGTVAELLRSSRAVALEAELHNLFPLKEGPAGTQVLYRLDLTPPPVRKVAFRSHAMARIADGNHYVFRLGRRAEGLVIADLPWRSVAQLRRKATSGARALDSTDLPAFFGSHWKTLAAFDDAALEQCWSDMLAGMPVKGLGWSPVGPFVDVPALSWDRWDPGGVLETSGISPPRSRPAN